MTKTTTMKATMPTMGQKCWQWHWWGTSVVLVTTGIRPHPNWRQIDWCPTIPARPSTTSLLLCSARGGINKSYSRLLLSPSHISLALLRDRVLMVVSNKVKPTNDRGNIPFDCGHSGDKQSWGDNGANVSLGQLEGWTNLTKIRMVVKYW
jgi:hypothetical protein